MHEIPYAGPRTNDQWRGSLPREGICIPGERYGKNGGQPALGEKLGQRHMMHGGDGRGDGRFQTRPRGALLPGFETMNAGRPAYVNAVECSVMQSVEGARRQGWIRERVALATSYVCVCTGREDVAARDGDGDTRAPGELYLFCARCGLADAGRRGRWERGKGAAERGDNLTEIGGEADPPTGQAGTTAQR